MNRSRYVVNIVGYSYSNETLTIVMDFMKRGSLYKVLHEYGEGEGEKQGEREKQGDEDGRGRRRRIKRVRRTLCSEYGVSIGNTFLGILTLNYL
jgi:hypothetical protein